MHGKGIYSWPDGRKYDGDYKEDKKHGVGTYTWTDGKRYIGEWRNNKRHGRGNRLITQGIIFCPMVPVAKGSGKTTRD